MRRWTFASVSILVLFSASVVRAQGDVNLKFDGNIETNDAKDKVQMHPCKIHEVKLQGGKSVKIDLMSNAFDAYLRVEDATGKEIAKDDDSGGNLNARLLLAVPADGTYKIIATTFSGGAGPYTLTIKSAVEPKAVKLKAPEAGKSVKVEDKLTADDPRDTKVNGPAKTFDVDLAAAPYQIDLMSKDLDSFLRVLDKNGQELASDDDGGDGLNSRLTFTPPAAGTYRIVATCLGGNRTGSFTLVIENKK